FSSNDTPPTAIYTLSLHDALPILAIVYGREGEGGYEGHAAAAAQRHRRRPPAADHPRPARLRRRRGRRAVGELSYRPRLFAAARSEEHTSELQSPYDLVCRLLLEK